VSSYDGTCSRSKRESGALGDVGDAALDSNRTKEGMRARARIVEGRTTADVRGVWKRRFVGVGMCRGAVLLAKARKKEDDDNDERMAV